MLRVHSGAAAAAAALFICALGLQGRAEAAAQFSVEPLLLTLPAERLATSLTLGNVGARPVTVQAELLTWTQDEGQERYAPVTGMVVSPPIFTLAANARQVVRIGRLKRTTPSDRELAYRIRLSEVPTDDARKSEMVSTVMQLSLPIFVPPADEKARPKLEFTAQVAAKGAVRIVVTNGGAIHDKITRLLLVQDGKAIAEQPQNYYVLAGAHRELVWPGALKGVKGGRVELKLQLDGRNRFISQPLDLVAPAPAATPTPGMTP